MHASSEAHQSSFGRLPPAIIVRPIVVKALLILLGVLPALALLAYIRAFAVNIPFMEYAPNPQNGEMPLLLQGPEAVVILNRAVWPAAGTGIASVQFRWSEFSPTAY